MAYKSIKYELCNLKAEYLEDTFQAAIYLIVSSWDKIPKADENIQLLVLSPCYKKKKALKGKCRNLESSGMYIFAFTTLLAINHFYIAGGACRGLSFANSLAGTERRRETGN